jgi:hypothetical protein
MDIKKTWDDLPRFAKGVIILGGIFLTYKGVKYIKKELNKPKPSSLPQGTAGLPVVSYDNSGNAVLWNPQPLAKALFEAMEGLFTGTETKDEVWHKFAELPTDSMAVSVYNYFNDKYGDGETLTAWIKAEKFTDIFGTGKAEALQRLQALQLG